MEEPGRMGCTAVKSARSTRFTHLSHGITQVTANYLVIAKLPFIHELANLIAKAKNIFHIRNNSAELAEYK